MTDDGFLIRRVSPDGLPGRMGVWDVTGASQRTYRVTVYDPDGLSTTCDCPDFRIRRRRCKHICAVIDDK